MMFHCLTEYGMGVHEAYLFVDLAITGKYNLCYLPMIHTYLSSRILAAATETNLASETVTTLDQQRLLAVHIGHVLARRIHLNQS